MSLRALALILLLFGCRPAAPIVEVPGKPPATVEEMKPVIVVPGKPVSPIVEAIKPPVDLPKAPTITAKGLALIEDGEGYSYHPSYAGGRSGSDLALGYDFSTVTPKLIVLDWAALPAPIPTRLAALHPFTGLIVRSKLAGVHDIYAPHAIGAAVFNNTDYPRFYAICKRAFPGFEELRPNARDAVVSLIYNRGASMVGPSRSHIRELPALIKAKNYDGLADCFRRMEKVWAGTSIEKGMIRRRELERTLLLTP